MRAQPHTVMMLLSSFRGSVFNARTKDLQVPCGAKDTTTARLHTCLDETHKRGEVVFKIDCGIWPVVNQTFAVGLFRLQQTVNILKKGLI